MGHSGSTRTTNCMVAK